MGRQFCAAAVSIFKGFPADPFHLLRYDFIEIRDGNSESADLLGKHCSNIAPPPIVSSGPVLHIKFVSDYAHQGAGFSLRYEILRTGQCPRLHRSHCGRQDSDRCVTSCGDVLYFTDPFMQNSL